MIHPDQAASVNAVFTPSRDEVTYAQRVVAAAALAAKRRRGSVSLDGRMIDAPVVARAEQVIALAQRINDRGA